MAADVGPDPARLERSLVQGVLRGGLGIGCALLLSGMVTTLATGARPPDRLRLFALLGHMDLGSRLVGLGILVLGLTPVARVAVLLAVWIRERDRRHASIAALVLLTLVASMFLRSAG